MFYINKLFQEASKHMAIFISFIKSNNYMQTWFLHAIRQIRDRSDVFCLWRFTKSLLMFMTGNRRLNVEPLSEDGELPKLKDILPLMEIQCHCHFTKFVKSKLQLQNSCGEFDVSSKELHTKRYFQEKLCDNVHDVIYRPIYQWLS